MAFAKNEIRHAIENREFVPYFQPLVDLRSGTLEGFEILARWHHPTCGLVPPPEFIPLIERHGLMNEFMSCILTQAFTAAQSIPTTIGFSANVSPLQLHDRSLPALFLSLAADAAFDLRRLTVEVTESALLDDLSLAGAVAADLKSLGMRLSLDDFGTGYSSLLHLQALPFDELKIDMSFVRSMVESRDSRKITAAVISLGQSLGLRTVGEGIENPRQAELLTWQGCHIGQGWLYSKAVPAADLPELLVQQFPGAISVASGLSEAPVSSTIGLEANPVDRLSQLRAIYNGAPVGLCFLDRDLRHVNINQQLADFNGLPIEAHLGRTVAELFPETFLHAEPYLRRALAGEATLAVEMTHIGAIEGSPALTLLTSYQPARDEADEVVGISISLVDITAIKQSEIALRNTSEHYKNTVDLSPNIPWVADATGKVLSISSRWQTVTGLTLEQSSGDGWLSTVDPRDVEQARVHWSEAIRTGQCMDMEFRIFGADKVWHWMRTRSTPYRDASGNITRWYGSIEFIDDQKQILQTLKESESMLRSVFDTAPAGLVQLDHAGIVTNANPRAQQILGCRIPHGSTWNAFPWKLFNRAGILVPVADLPLSRAIRLGESSTAVELKVRRPDHSDLWISATAAPVFSEQGKIVGGILAMMDLDVSRHGQGGGPQKPLAPSRAISKVHILPPPAQRFG